MEDLLSETVVAAIADQYRRAAQDAAHDFADQRGEHDRWMKRTLYLVLAGLAACRKGELAKLRWELVDLARNVITVPKIEDPRRRRQGAHHPDPPGLAPVA